MRSIHNPILVLFISFLLFSCAEEAPSPNPKDVLENQESIDAEEPVTLSNGTEDDSVHWNLLLEELTKTESNLIVDLELFGKSWIVSPTEKEYPYGCMKIELDSNENIRTIGNIQETPTSEPLRPGTWDESFKVISGKTTLKQKIEVLSKDDFVAKGNIFFVLEPVCNPYEIDFKIIQESGQLKLETTPMYLAPGK